MNLPSQINNINYAVCLHFRSFAERVTYKIVTQESDRLRMVVTSLDMIFEQGPESHILKHF